MTIPNLLPCLEALLRAAIPNLQAKRTALLLEETGYIKLGRPAFDRILAHIRAEKAAAAQEQRRFLIGAYVATHGEDPPADMSSLIMLGSISTMHSKKLFEANERVEAAEAAALERAANGFAALAMANKNHGHYADTAGDRRYLDGRASAFTQAAQELRQSIATTASTAYTEAIAAAREEGRKEGLAQAAKLFRKKAYVAGSLHGAGPLARKVLLNELAAEIEMLPSPPAAPAGKESQS